MGRRTRRTPLAIPLILPRTHLPARRTLAVRTQKGRLVQITTSGDRELPVATGTPLEVRGTWQGGSSAGEAAVAAAASTATASRAMGSTSSFRASSVRATAQLRPRHHRPSVTRTAARGSASSVPPPLPRISNPVVEKDISTIFIPSEFNCHAMGCLLFFNKSLPS